MFVRSVMCGIPNGRQNSPICCLTCQALVHLLLLLGADRRRNALSEEHSRQHSGIRGSSTLQNDIPWLRTLYSRSTITSISLTAASLKFFLTAMASCSLGTFLFALRLAMVGDCLPIPGLLSRNWLRIELNAEGVSMRCAARYCCKSDRSSWAHVNCAWKSALVLRHGT